MNMRQPLNGIPRHWHLTRDIKPRGECKACDAYWQQYDEIEARAGLKSVTDIGHPPHQGDSKGDRSVTDI